MMSTVFWSQCFIFHTHLFFLPGILAEPPVITQPTNWFYGHVHALSPTSFGVTVPASYNQYTFLQGCLVGNSETWISTSH